MTYETSWRWQRRTLYYGEGRTLSLTSPVPWPDAIVDLERAFAEQSTDIAEMRRLWEEDPVAAEEMYVTIALQHAAWAAFWAGAHPEPYARREWSRAARFFEKTVHRACERPDGWADYPTIEGIQ